MDTVLSGMEEFALSFIDDICIYSSTFEEHMRHLELVLEALQKANLTAQPTKVQLAMNKINFLEGIRIPRTKRDVRGFLGFIGFYRTFIKSFSEVAAPLSDLLRKESPELVPWTEKTQRAFNQLKSALQTAPVLIAPNFSKKFFVLVDSSQFAVGAVLCHTDKEVMQPILFIGRKFTPCETRLSATEREVLGILSMLTKLKYYLLGRNFVLLTDVKSLVYLKNAASKSAKLTRWSLLLSEFEFEVAHVPGHLFKVPDYLSRYVEFTEANSTPTEASGRS